MRGEAVVAWLKKNDVDILLMQEIKCVDEDFPYALFEKAGYQIHCHGQKTYNGVAVASRLDVETRRRGLPTSIFEDEQARYIEIEHKKIIIAGVYLPNGNPITDEPQGKFAYKLDWMERLYRHAETLNAEEKPVIFGGDFNIIPQALDCHDIESWRGDALHHPKSLAMMRKLTWLGYTDLYRALHPSAAEYSFWDYQGGAWQKDNGIRIDYFLTNPEATDLVLEAGIDKTPRGQEKASDHTPIWCRLTV